ncbi:hypothetical protein BDV33DRAFT_205773 [Aspergillus novoparasiticus]|uniref:Uncharacterized protein n=1 Tax=Aspergillus novoparasiticus TaxID=986946 RepID=A0A5N6EK46_9EURO|nr:hypothetical protein BDV33DRAFT_205773 [Aspergillus novoparasiticus]
MAILLHNAEQEVVHAFTKYVAEYWCSQSSGAEYAPNLNQHKLTCYPFTGMEKAPSVGVQLNGTGLPRVVFESGFPQNGESLWNDMIDWLLGGGGAVQAVILINWKPSQDTMRI